MVVADVNVIAYLLIPGERSLLAEKAFRKDPDWIVPLLWRSEFRNIVALYMRQTEMSLAQAKTTAERAESLMRGNEYSVPSKSVLTWVAESKLSAYDAEYVALAEDLSIKLITFDKKLLKEAPFIAIGLEDFVSPSFRVADDG